MRTTSFKKAMNFIFSNENIIFNKRPKLDKRYKENKDAIKIINSNQLKHSQRMEIWELRILRGKRKARVPNFLENPLIADYFRNKNSIKFISEDRISFWDGRNHYAKSPKDRKILSILSKYR